MHYGGKKKDCVRLVNEPYMTLKPSNQEIPENKKLSALDIQTLKEFYAPPMTYAKLNYNILVLNTKRSSNKPMTVGFSGE